MLFRLLEIILIASFPSVATKQLYWLENIFWTKFLVTLELSTAIDAISKIEKTYKVSNVKFDNVDVETILDTELTVEENAKYAAMAEAMAEYYSGLALAIQPVD